MLTRSSLRRLTLLILAACLTIAPAARAQEPNLRQVLGGGYQYGGGVVFSPDGKTLATGTGGVVYCQDSPELEPGELARWDVAVRTLKESGPWVQKVTYSPDGKLLAAVCSIGGDNFRTDLGEVKVWDVVAGKVVTAFGGKGVGATSVEFSPSDRLLAWGRSGGAAAIVVEVTTWKAVHTLDGLKGDVQSLAFSPDGKRLVAAGGAWDPPDQQTNSGAVWLWDLGTGKDVAHWREPGGGVSAVVFSPNGQMLASGSYDGAVRL